MGEKVSYYLEFEFKTKRKAEEFLKELEENEDFRDSQFFTDGEIQEEGKLILKHENPKYANNIKELTDALIVQKIVRNTFIIVSYNKSLPQALIVLCS